MGAWASEIFQEQGGKVVAVSDAFGAIHNEKGLDIKALRKHITSGNALKDFPEGLRLSVLLSALLHNCWKAQDEVDTLEWMHMLKPCLAYSCGSTFAAAIVNVPSNLLKSAVAQPAGPEPKTLSYRRRGRQWLQF